MKPENLIPTSTSRSRIRSSATKVCTDAVFSSKRHFEAGDYFSRWSTRAAAVIATLTVITASSLLLSNPQLTLMREALALAAAVVASVVGVYNPAKRATRHHQHGDGYSRLWKEVQHFMDTEIDNPAVPEKALQRELSQFLKRLEALNSSAIDDAPPSWVYEQVRYGVEGGEADYDEK